MRHHPSTAVKLDKASFWKRRLLCPALEFSVLPTLSSSPQRQALRKHPASPAGEAAPRARPPRHLRFHQAAWGTADVTGQLRTARGEGIPRDVCGEASSPPRLRGPCVRGQVDGMQSRRDPLKDANTCSAHSRWWRHKGLEAGHRGAQAPHSANSCARTCRCFWKEKTSLISIHSYI